MKNLALSSAPDYYKGYIELAPDKPLIDVLPTGGIELYINDMAMLHSIGQRVYAPSKWTVNELIQHLIDTERIFINRALRFVREDDTELPGYDHNAYVPASMANNQSIEALLEEYQTVRKSTELLYRPLTDKQLLYSGTANGTKISALSIGYILIGHPIHHFNVIMERYL
ncbi:MAG: DinB family protein [Crocinitomix sp.]|nr:DinB family protein [Crocinitomix sp.]